MSQCALVRDEIFFIRQPYMSTNPLYKKGAFSFHHNVVNVK